MYFNQVSLCGFVGSVQIFDEEVKKPCARISLATHKRFKSKEGEVQEKTQWHTLVCFGKHVKVVKEKISAGSQLLIVGELDYQEWTSEQGEKRNNTQIIVRNFLILDSEKGKGAVDAYQQWMAEEQQAPKTKFKSKTVKGENDEK